MTTAQCEHDISQMDDAVYADGLCPLCQQATITRLRALLGRAGSALDGYQGIGSAALRQSVRDAIKKELGE